MRTWDFKNMNGHHMMFYLPMNKVMKAQYRICFSQEFDMHGGTAYYL